MSARPRVDILTTRRATHPSLASLVEAIAERGCDAVVGPALTPSSAVIFRYGHDIIAANEALARFCRREGRAGINLSLRSRRAQLLHLERHGIAVLPFAWARSREAAREAAQRLGFPLRLLGAFSGRARNGVVIADEAQLDAAWSPLLPLIQSWPCSDRFRVTVVGGRAIHAAQIIGDAHAARRPRYMPRIAVTELAAPATAIARACDLEIAAVELAAVARGFACSDIDYRAIDFCDARRNGATIRSEVADLLVHTARVAPSTVVRARRGAIVVTGHPTSALPAALARRGISVVADMDEDAECALLWGLGPAQHRRAAAAARLLGIRTLEGEALTLAAQRAALYRAGIAVPRWWLVRDASGRRRAATALGYPVYCGSDVLPGHWSPRLVLTPEELEAQPLQAGMVEEMLWAAQQFLRVFVVDGRPLFAERVTLADLAHGPAGPGTTQRVVAPERAAQVALSACATLGAIWAVVELVEMPDCDTVLRVLHLAVPTERLRPALGESVADALAASLLAPAPALATAAPSAPLLRVLSPRRMEEVSDERSWSITSVYRHFLRRNEIAAPATLDAAAIETADIILMDPIATAGQRSGADVIDRIVYQRARERTHLLRSERQTQVNKRQMATLAKRLGVPTPRVFEQDELSASLLPVIAKPTRGSEGRGVRVIATLDELASLQHSGLVVQEFIDSGTGAAVSARVITVAGHVAAAAMLYNPEAVCSNFSQGGRMIALTGPGRRARLASVEKRLLEQIGIVPDDRHVPSPVAAMALTVGRFFSAHGVQMLGQDYVVDHQGRWFLLEANRNFGLAAFNVTDGSGFPCVRRGYAHAGRVLGDAIRAAFARSHDTR